ncbi:MAG: hypothetical protein HZB13_02500 [Acidobacteria bacterium]|nr:hypothetical protein [Acidobacteriota bacterium]
MAASPYRCTVTIDGTKFDAVSTTVRFHSDKDRAGMPQMGSLATNIRVIADFHDDKNVPFSAIKKFFELASVVTREKIKDIKIEFWKDDKHEDALCSYAFKGWISRFETSNPHPLGNSAGEGADNLQTDPALAYPSLNHVMVLDLEPTLNQEKFKEIKMSN